MLLDRRRGTSRAGQQGRAERQGTREDKCVPDVSLYVAGITAAAGVVGGCVSLIPVYLRDIRQARQDRRDRQTDAQRQACLDLLRAAGDLRTGVANAGDYHGDEMADRLAEIRRFAAAVQIHAATVELLATGKVSGTAAGLARAADKFVVAAVANTDLQLKQMVAATDPTELSKAMEAFRKQAVEAAP
jgi:hypothetical protein